MSLQLDIEIGDTLLIDNGRVRIDIDDKSGRKTRLSIHADRSIKIEKVKTYQTQGPKGGLRERCK